MNSSGFLHVASRDGKVWAAASNPEQVNPTWIGNTVFNTMTPILVFRNPADSGTKAIIDSLTLFINNTPGGFVSVRVQADRIDRYVTLSGTLHDNGNADQALTQPATLGRPALTSALEIYDELVELEDTTFTNTISYNGSDVVATSSPGEIDGGVMAASAGAFLNLDFRGAFILEPGTIAAVYAWAATTAPEGRFAMRWMEEKSTS
jgi:hypothetical protein